MTSASGCASPRSSATKQESRYCGTGRPMFETVQQLLRSRMADDTVAMKHGDATWTWREHLAEAAAEASALIALADASRPMHIGALLGNSPAMLRSMAAAAL